MARTKKQAATSEQTLNLIENTENATAMVNTEKVTILTTEEAKRTYNDFREGLKKFTNSLVELAKQQGRTEYTLNGLLRESYLLQPDTELDTFEGWKQKGGNVRKGQHAYLFWGAPTTSKAGFRYCPVAFKFSREQVYFPEA